MEQQSGGSDQGERSELMEQQSGGSDQGERSELNTWRSDRET